MSDEKLFRGEADVSTGICIVGIRTHWFPAIMWRGGYYAIQFRWAWPPIKFLPFQMNSAPFVDEDSKDAC